jgi:serine/threonine-protein kinase
MVSAAGHVKVLDFGLARRFRGLEPAATGLAGLDGSTILGRPLGTASYMAPERILQMPLDPRCDLFSLGVVIYEMATGRLPFAGASPADTVTNVLDNDPPPLTSLAPDRPKALEKIVSRLLAKRASDRYQTAAGLQEALEALGTEPRGFGHQLWERLRRGQRQ